MTVPTDSVQVSRRFGVEDLLREQVEAARSQTRGEKLIAGIELFKLSCEFMRAGIRIQHPNATDEQVFNMIEARLALARKLEYRA